MSINRPSAKELLDQLASSAIAKSASDLRAELIEAGVDPDAKVKRLRSLFSASVERYRNVMIHNLPEAVPKARSEMRALLEHLMQFPGLAKDDLVGAFRDKEDLTDNDLRVLTENLLRLIKRRVE